MENIVFIILFVLIFVVFFKLFYDRGKIKKIYSRLCSEEGYSDLTGEPEKKDDLAEKILKFPGISHKPHMGGLLVKEEEEKTIYLADAHVTRGRTRASATEETILYITLPVEVKNTYVIREKLSYLLETISEVLVTQCITVSKLNENFSEKFLLYSLYDIDEPEVLTQELQECFIKHAGRYPFSCGIRSKQSSIGWVVISDKTLCIFGSRIIYDKWLDDIYSLADNLSSVLLKSSYHKGSGEISEK